MTQFVVGGRDRELSPSTYGVRNLLTAVLEARLAGDGPDEYATWCRARAEALVAAFQPGESDLAFLLHGGPTSQPGLDRLFDDAVSSWVSAASPFGSALEAPEAVMRLHQRHGSDLRESVEHMQSLVLDLMVTILEEEGIDPALTVTDDQVRLAGWDPVPDPRSVDDW